MASLPEVLSEIRDRILKYKGRRINEENTKAILIDPVLRTLGWNLEDLEEVQREYKVKRRDRPMDYGLFRDREPVLIVEAKALREDAADRRWTQQIMGYATVAGVPWVLLTNGAEYRLYNALAPVPVDRKLFRLARVLDQPDETMELLSLLQKSRMGERDLDQLWQAYYVDQEVRAVIEDLFTPGAPDNSAINLVRKRVKNLSTKDVKVSLTRMRIELDFPQLQVTREKKPVTKPTPRPKIEDKIPPVRQEVSVQDLIQAGFIHPPLILEKNYKGKHLTAQIERDGTVTFAGKGCVSLSTAGGEARKTVIGTPPGHKLPPTNGWKFWRFKDRDGQLNEIDNLRQRYLQEKAGKLRVVK